MDMPEVQPINYVAADLRRVIQSILPQLTPEGLRLRQVGLDGWKDLRVHGQVSGPNPCPRSAFGMQIPAHLNEGVIINIMASEEMLRMIAHTLEEMTGKEAAIGNYFGAKHIEFAGPLAALRNLDMSQFRSQLIQANAARSKDCAAIA